MAFQAGDRLIHRLNPELGPGQVQAVEGRALLVHFPLPDTTLRLAAESEALEPLVLRPGLRVRIGAAGPSAVIAGFDDAEVEAVAAQAESRRRVRLEDGRILEAGELWPLAQGDELVSRLAAGEVDSPEAFALRLDAVRLRALREADGLGSFLGGRIRLFPHQLYVAERATRSDPVRWLLADEVGLGKTVESCLILNHLIYGRRAERVLVVAPETLTVQWLGELWRKYHRVFVLLDPQRLRDVARDHGGDFNPFDVHRHAVISQELLAETPRLTEQAVAAGIDLLVVDEAHRLRRPPGHPGNAQYRSIEPIAALGNHVLLLTAVPLEDDLHGFFRLLQLLRPADFPDFAGFEKQLDSGRRLPACTSATRRSDIGGLPPRQAHPIDLPADAAFEAREARLNELLAEPAPDPLARRAKAARVRSELGRILADADPRVRWLAERARAWQSAAEKVLVFVSGRDELEALRGALSRRLGQRLGVFHEGLSSKQRDIEVAQFRLSEGPTVLISTECGGEGRNFEFCARLVLFDLPWSPMTVEQRIGRLDRIGRRQPVEIVYFRPPAGLGATVARLYERLGLFERPLTSIETELRGIEGAIEELATASGPDADALDDEQRFSRLLADAQRAYDRVERAAFHELHAEPYRVEMAPRILERVPAELGALTERVIAGVARELGLRVEEHWQGRRHWIELDAEARVESLPGVRGEASFLGTFRREEAVEDETLDFFASGHPLVEGLLAHLEESPVGRVTLLHLDAEGPGFGLVAVYQRGHRLEGIAIDQSGRERRSWVDAVLASPLPAREVRARAWLEQPAWPQMIRKIGRHLEDRGRPLALAAVRVSAER